MAKPLIALDLDDTLYEHFSLLVNWHNATYGSRLTLADNHPFSPRHWGTPALQRQTLARWNAPSVPVAAQRVRAFFDTPQFKNAAPFKGAQSVLDDLAQTHTIVVVTARDLFLEDFTRTWLRQKFGGVISDVVLTARYNLDGHSKDKLDVLLRRGATCVIDDDLELCLRATKAGIAAIVFGDYPWNQDKGNSSIRRAKNWDDVRKYIQS